MYGASFELKNLDNNYLYQTLRNNGFLELVQGEKRSLHRHSGIPFKEFDMKSEGVVERYIYDYVLLSREVPKMSTGAMKKVFRSIFEIYQNAVMHSGAANIYVCGQFYRVRKRMALTMVEIGHSFKHNVQNHIKQFESLNGLKCIEWAVQSGNTTKPKDETGGLGLDLIRSFLIMNEGKLQIRSADGYWQEKSGLSSGNLCKNSFNGSIVNIEFNLLDKNQYFTQDELDVKDIF